MERLTFYQSLLKILNMILSVPLLLEVLILTLFLLVAMVFFYFKKSKKGKITTLIIYLITLILLPISHISFFINTLDKLVENFVKIIYFPSCYIYLLMLIITDVGVCRELVKSVKENKTKWYTSINLIYFFIFQFLFFLIIRVVSTNNVDIFNKSELYSNSLLVSTIQISSYLFWIRIGIKFLMWVINKLSKFEIKPKEAKEKIDESINNTIPSQLDNSNNIDNNLNNNDNNLNSINTIDNISNINSTENINNNISVVPEVETVLPLNNLETNSTTPSNNVNNSILNFNFPPQSVEKNNSHDSDSTDKVLIDDEIIGDSNIETNNTIDNSINNVEKNDGNKYFYDDFYE